MLRRLAILFCALALAACGARGDDGPIVLAAASMQEALEEIADAWAAEGHARPVLSFAGTPTLARQAEAGAPADVFISADAQWMDSLARAGLIRSGTRRTVAGNRMVVVVPADDMPFADEFANVTHGRVAMADPDSVPAGRYAKAALESFGGWDEVQSGLIPTDNVRAALALVERGEASRAVVYQSDAMASDKVSVIHRFPADATPNIAYPAAVLAASENPDAEGFVAYLGSARAQAILRRHGFVTAGE